MLAILSTHPIQYQVPLWQALARDGRVPFEVWYLTDHGARKSFDREFGGTFAWDLEMLSGYPHKFLSVAPGASPASFRGCRLTEDLGDRLHASGARALWFQGWQVAAYWQAAWHAKRSGVELWLRAESNGMAPRPFWKASTRRLALAQLFRRIDRFLCIGTANRRLYESFGVPATRLYAAPYAVDTPRFERQIETLTQDRLTLRRRWGIPDDAMCVLFCGKFIPKKRPLDLVAAAQLTRHPVHLLFVGSGELGAQLRAHCEVAFDGEAESAAVKGVVSRPGGRPPASFTGFLNQTEISRAYAAADCLVLPSGFDETWGLVVNEAMASGLPCLISDRCGSAQDLGRTPPNRTFPCGDAATLAGTLDEMLAAPRPACGTRALPSFEQTIETVVQLWTEIAALREERIGS